MRTYSISTIRDLSEYEELHHLSTQHHEQCVAEMVFLLGNQLNLDRDVVREYAEAGRYHDIGKTTIDRKILNKPGKLDPSEWSIVTQHCEIGAMMLSKMWTEHRTAYLGALTHHENFDGTGYPHGLKGTEIPLVGRVISVCDVYHALREDRAYRPAFGHDKAMNIMHENSHKFDPEIFRNFKAIDEHLLDDIIAQKIDA